MQMSDCMSFWEYVIAIGREREREERREKREEREFIYGDRVHLAMSAGLQAQKENKHFCVAMLKKQIIYFLSTFLSSILCLLDTYNPGPNQLKYSQRTLTAT